MEANDNDDDDDDGIMVDGIMTMLMTHYSWKLYLAMAGVGGRRRRCSRKKVAFVVTGTNECGCCTPITAGV